MPIYEFKCPACKKKKEILMKIKDPAPVCDNPQCTNHTKSMIKQVSVSNFELKGGGWAKDGYGS